MRALYRRDTALWVDLVEQAAVMAVVLAGDVEGDEDRVWCARRLLKEMLLEVAWDRGLRIDPAVVVGMLLYLSTRVRRPVAAPQAGQVVGP
jgi:hypothetical protein